MTYTVFKIEITQKLSHKEHLDNLDELNTWIASCGHNNILVKQDETGKAKIGFMIEKGKYHWRAA